MAVTGLASLLSFFVALLFINVEALYLGIPSVASGFGFAYVSVRPPRGFKLLLVVVLGLLAIVLLLSIINVWWGPYFLYGGA